MSGSSQTQLSLSSDLKKYSKADESPAPMANVSVLEPKYLISKETGEVGIADPPGKVLDSNSGGSGQNGISCDPLLSRPTILSEEGLDLVEAEKNVVERSTVSSNGRIFSTTPSSEAVISNCSSLISNGISGIVYEKSTPSVLIESSSKPCDVLDGRWVYDESYPLYSSNSCPYIDEGFSCEANGRTDAGYMKWRWQPNSCNIPRYNSRHLIVLAPHVCNLSFSV